MIQLSRRFAYALVAILLALSPAVAPAIARAQTPEPRVSMAEPKYTAIVMDARTGEVLYQQRADSPRYPASVTKLMTFYLAFDALASGRLRLNDLVVVSPLAAAQPPTKLGLRAGEMITVEDALHAMAVHSANDMAVAISERIGGSESRFAALMTLKAQQLGMTNTRYVNANGLPDSRQVSTARDLAILTRAILRDFPQYYSFFSQQQFTYRGRTFVNTNHLLGKMPGVDGLKTGFTNAAGYNLAASAMRNGNRLIAVVMGESSGTGRNSNVEGLLLTGFDVLERRARGERILVAQNMFEPAPAYRYLPPMRVEQGDTDEDPIDVVLTGATARPGPVSTAPTMASALRGRPMLMADLGRRPAPEPAAAAPFTRRAQDWWVQVGVFRSHRAAMAQIDTLSHRFARLFDDSAGRVEGRGHAYSARFSGLTETAARDACSTVKSRGVPCEAHGPA
ncbi:MAG TPA: D-alanyl-D-alanine carboxypeptidase family protein [Caulobacteraceae bacterium]